MKKKTCRLSVALLLLPVLAMLSGCGGDGKPEGVEERAQARWDHMVAREHKLAWEYFSPGYRETTSAEAFEATMGRRPVRYEAAQVLGSDCDAETCKVRVEVTYRVPGAPTGINSLNASREVVEDWIRAEGRWWLVPAG